MEEFTRFLLCHQTFSSYNENSIRQAEAEVVPSSSLVEVVVEVDVGVDVGVKVGVEVGVEGKSILSSLV